MAIETYGAKRERGCIYIEWIYDDNVYNSAFSTRIIYYRLRASKIKGKERAKDKEGKRRRQRGRRSVEL